MTEDPQKVLNAVTRLRNGARSARPRRSIPLLILALTIGFSLPLYKMGTPDPAQSGQMQPLSWDEGGFAGIFTNFEKPELLTAYWLLALPVAYLLIAAYVLIAGYSTGVRGSIIRTVATGIVVYGAACLVIFGAHWFRWLIPDQADQRGMVPVLIIAIGLLGWSLAQRDSLLIVIAIVNFAASILAGFYDLANLLNGTYLTSSQALYPNILLPTVVLLVSAFICALSEQRRR